MKFETEALRQAYEKNHREQTLLRRKYWQTNWVHCDFRTSIDCMRGNQWPEFMPFPPTIGMLIEPVGAGYGEHNLKVLLRVGSVVFKEWYYLVQLEPREGCSIKDVEAELKRYREPPIF